MALQDILDKIKEQTETRLKEVEKQFEERKKNLEKEFETKHETIKQEMGEKVEENKKKITEKTLSLAEQERKKQILKAKHEIIEKAFDQAIEELSKSEKYEVAIGEMLKNIDLADENIEIVPARGKEEITAKAIKSIGKNYSLSEKSANIRGGFLVKSGNIELDNSFENIIKNQLQSDLEIKLNKLIFA